MSELSRRILSGDVGAVARACRLIDEGAPEAEALSRALLPYARRARVVGITGAPGTGKSTLTAGLVEKLRARGERVAVLAVDPSSPFTGGALLGDRIRMLRHAEDPEVFIRSFGTRGAHGGLARGAVDSIAVLAAWGAHTILIETVGAGQVEVDVLDVADTVVVVVIPGMGDDIQANKAGILEVADVFALNKSDRPGADAAEHELLAAMSLGRPQKAPVLGHHAAATSEPDASGLPRIVRTVATEGQGLDALLAAILEHGHWLETSELGRERRALRREQSLTRQLRELLCARLQDALEPELRTLAARVGRGELDVYAAARELLVTLGLAARGLLFTKNDA